MSFLYDQCQRAVCMSDPITTNASVPCDPDARCCINTIATVLRRAEGYRLIYDLYKIASVSYESD